MGNTFNQNHSGSGDNIINFSQPRLEMTPELIDKIAANLDTTQPVALVWRKKRRGDQLAAALENGLLERGFTIGMKAGIGEISGVEFAHPITISPNGFRFPSITIVGGQQAVAIETDL